MISKEKRLMTSFFIANISDSLVSFIALNSDKGFSEVGIMGRDMAGEGHLELAIIVKLGIVALIVGSYALAKTNNIQSFEYSYRQTMRITSVLVWGVTAFNAIQLMSS